MTASDKKDKKPRLGVMCDLREENWPSMDLAADMLLEQLTARHTAQLQAVRLCPTMKRRVSQWPLVGKKKFVQNTDRLLNRFWDYPRWLAPQVKSFDLFHVCDHSYAQLVHQLPPQRTGVFCHDLDTFRCLLDPAAEPRPSWFRKMARHILQGLQKAEVVFHTTRTVRQQIEQYGILDEKRLVQAPYGISSAFTPQQTEEDDAVRSSLPEEPFLLHVGSCIPRKRIDVLLNVFAEVHTTNRFLKLVQVGGEWTAEQQNQIERLGIRTAVRQLPRQPQQRIAAYYRRAALVLMTSEAEGFGLPVAEALACGSVVVATDLPVFREVGQEAAVYCRLADSAEWAATIHRLLGNPGAAPDSETRLAQAGRFSWAEHTRIIAEAYRQLS